MMCLFSRCWGFMHFDELMKSIYLINLLFSPPIYSNILLLKTLHHNHKVCRLEVLFQNEKVQTSMYSSRHTIIENITFFIPYHYSNKIVKYDGNMHIT